MILRARSFEFRFPRPALVMGIVNVTPDSFSDGGRYSEPAAAVEHALRLVQQGADILDIGGESTRPGAMPVPEAEELRRVMPVLEALVPQVRVAISIDTMKPSVARAAVEAGASIINDVGANRSETGMWRLAAETGAAYVCMHMQGNPQTMQVNPRYEDVAREVEEFFCERLQRMSHCGITGEQTILDPGIGFGKKPEHNLALLGEVERFARLGRPLLIGVSRKSFLGAVAGGGTGDRLPAALACVCLAVEAGASVVRVHDVGETVQALRMAEAIVANKKL